MMKMTNNFNARWDALGSDPLRSVFQLYDADHPMDFYIGKDSDNQRLFLLVTTEVPPAIRDMRAIHIRSFIREDGKWSLLLSLENNALAPMFSMLCEDLFESSRSTGLPANKSLGFVLKRLSNWRRLLELGIPDLLSENENRGLCGELLFLQRLMNKIGQPDAVKAWVGPKKASQDFQTQKNAWEVKTIWPNATSVTISSESQLQTTIRLIHLVVIELADSVPDVGDTFTLNSLVEKIRTCLAADHDISELFEESLITAGYVTRNEYNAINLIEHAMSMFAVEIGFPCISSETLAVGINHVKYDISLSACEKYRIDTTSFTDNKDHQ